MADEDIPPWRPPWNANRAPETLTIRHTAEALGWLIMRWGLLEFELGSMLLILIGATQRYEIVGHIDLREKIQIVKSVGFEVQPSPGWFSRTEELMNKIDQRLRSERNRMIHDMWILHHDSQMPMVRFGMTPKLRRPQSRQRTQERDIIPVSDQEIWALVLEVNRAISEVRDLTAAFQQNASRGKSE